MAGRAGVVKPWGSPAHISKTKPGLAKFLKCVPCKTLDDRDHEQIIENILTGGREHSE